MYDWGPKKIFKSYTYHINSKDAITYLGMNDPFRACLTSVLAGTANIGALSSGHAEQVLAAPLPPLYDAWLNFNTVIHQDSSAIMLNAVEHNLLAGHVGNAMSVLSTLKPDTYPLTSVPIPNKFLGKARCMAQK